MTSTGDTAADILLGIICAGTLVLVLFVVASGLIAVVELMTRGEE